MANPLRPIAWRGPPLALQITGLMLGALVVAQLVTLALTLFLPPEPPAKYGLAEIASAVRAPAAGSGLRREVRDAAPAVDGRGWLSSPTSRNDLARLLGVVPDRIRLAFYTPLPFAGTAGDLPAWSPPPRAASPPARPAPIAFRPSPGEAADEPAMRLAVLLVPRGRVSPTTLLRLVQAGPSGPGGPPMGAPGGGFPGGGFPGAGFPGGGMPRGGMPSDGLPLSPPRGAMPPSGVPTGMPTGSSPAAPSGPPASLPPVAPATGVPPAGGVGSGTTGAPPGTTGAPSQGPVATPPPFTNTVPGAPPILALPPRTLTAPVPGVPPASPVPNPATPRPRDLARKAARSTDGVRIAAPPPGTLAEPARTVDGRAADARPAAAPRIPEPAASAKLRPAPATGAPAVAAADAPIRRTGLQGAIDRARRLFGLAPAPFVEGDFVAAVALADGRWIVVQPRSGGLLTPWQKRVALWFLIAIGITAPIGWLFARRLSRPLDRFADAAAQLGRDPSVAIAALDGPAEIGRAAHAFNLMQQRLRSFVDDRTAMVGAISHDLRTPLTRMRFRVEDVPNDVRGGLLQEVDEMEEMITSVLAFIRDASTPGVRERLDLRTLLDDVAEDVAVIGAAVPVEADAAATVEVDVMGMRRVLANLVENALKYGDHARIRLTVSRDEAIAAVIDDGPGLPDDELEQVFQPFYRTASARASGAPGTGLGLAVCRSIARAHGGDVRLYRTGEGFKAEVRVPLVYDAARALAA